MRRVQKLHPSSVGQKVAMALSGTLLFAFVFVHMLGNLKVYLGPAEFDGYARFLREVGHPFFAHAQLLWLARAGLFAALLVHGVAAIQLTRVSRRARPVAYQRRQDLSFSYASRTMRWGGVMLLAFVVYHVLHLTFGVGHASFEPSSPYHNVLRAFQAWPVTVAYVAAMAPLALHIYHGLWSATQTLALTHARLERWRRPVAAAVAGLIFLGNVSVPLAVLAGLVR